MRQELAYFLFFFPCKRNQKNIYILPSYASNLRVTHQYNTRGVQRTRYDDSCACPLHSRPTREGGEAEERGSESRLVTRERDAAARDAPRRRGGGSGGGGGSIGVLGGDTGRDPGKRDINHLALSLILLLSRVLSLSCMWDNEKNTKP